MGQAGERARGAGEAEEAAAPGTTGPGAGYRSEQGRHAQLLTRHEPPPQLLVLFLLPYGPPIRRLMTAAPTLAQHD